MTGAMLHGCQLYRAILKDAVLLGADLTAADMRWVVADGVNLARARLHDADLSDAELRLANFSHADLSQALLVKADLWGAALDEADMTGANLSGANLERSTLRTSKIAGACFNDTYLRGAQIECGEESAREATLSGMIRDRWKPLEPPGLEGRISFRDRLHEKPTHTVVRVFFATDRAEAKDGAEAQELFGSGRGGQLRYGSCEVSIPRDHRMGRFEAPSIWRLELRWNERKHLILRSVRVLSPKRFFDNVQARPRHSRAREALVFIHGFNVSFANATRRAAQLSYDLAFDGPPIVYSWTSEGGVRNYPHDATNARLAVTDFAIFLEQLRELSEVQRVHLIAHSMGGRVLFDGLKEHI